MSGQASLLTYSHALRTATTREPHPQPSREPSSKASLNPRNMKQTLKSRYERYIEALREPDSDDEMSSKTCYQELLKQVHTNEVKDYLDEREPNKVLDEKPPGISTKETLLPRRTRRTLAQLRSGYSPYLDSYAKRIGTVDYDCCPNCNIEPHTTRQLFNFKKKKNSDTTIPLRSPNRSCELPRNNRLQRGHSLTESNNNNMRKIDINSQVVKIH